MNINLWFARDIHTDEIVSILDAKQDNKYRCPICNSEAIPKALESKKVTSHFAHIDRSKCSSEAMIHWWYKHRFIETGDTFTIKTDEEIQFTCKSFEVEKECELSNGTYKPDLVVHTECGNEIVFEMANTNKKKVEDYINQWIELGRIIVEVDIKSMVNDHKIFNALYYKGKCFNFNKRDGGYYNTIGKIKERMVRSDSYDIELAKKLDWFWKELFVYTKENKRNGDYFFELFEYVIFNDLSNHEIKEVIKKHKFEYIYKEYCKYKNEQMKDYFNKVKNKYIDYEINIIVSNMEYYNSLKYGYSIHHIASNGRNGLYTSTMNSVDEIHLEQSVEIDYYKLENKRYENWLEDKFINFIKNKLNDSVNLINIKFIKKYNLDSNYNVLFDEIFVKKDYIELLFDVRYKDDSITDLRFSISNNNLSVDFMIKQLFNEIHEIFKDRISLLRNMKNIFGIIYKYIKVKHTNNEFYFSGSYDGFDRISMKIKESKSKHGWNDVFEYEIIDGKIIGYNNNEITTFNELKSNFSLVIENKIRNCKCISCNQCLKLSHTEIEFFLDKGFELPKRCKACRQKRKKGE